ncbi:hypothetical protein [Longimicrobium sp.]|uniref:hypothetical protein n=1 Tax=Longimicrobium sp. TaxID=2029185 RepID=UPI002E33B233|nr:hypothetical protein [Longimicrobium sp.]HEX6036652.1 hypothetical protein [Longimicrobium sp.]
MRPSIVIAVVAALALAAPIAAQPEPDGIAAGIMAEALKRAHDNVPARVSNYVLTLTSGPVRTELYVHRDGDGWEVEEQDDAPLADLFKSMIVWPRLAAEHRAGATDTSEIARDARYVTSDTVGDRVAHVLRARVPGLAVETMDIPDSAYVAVDARTRQLLRVVAAADVEPSAGGAMINGGRVTLQMTFSDHAAVNGVTVPRRLHVLLRMQANLTDEQRAAMRDGLTAQLAAPADPSQTAVQTRMLMEMFLRMLDGETMEISADVEDVRVNTGPPAWLIAQDPYAAGKSASDASP